MSGWIKLHRRLLDWEWYDDQNVFRVFMHLLLTANFEPSKYKGYDIPAGCKVAGVHALAEQTGLTSQKVRTALDKLKSTKEITIKTTNKFSIISVRCWNDYQRDNKQITNHQQTSNKQVTTSKEGKELKKERKKVEYTEDFETWWKSYPHRTDKPEAFKYFKEVCPTEISLEDLLSQTLKYTQKCKSDEISFKGAMRWLKDRRFEDDFDLFNAGKRVVG